MDVKVKKSDIIDFTFTAPPSKSYTHRAYAIALLSDGISTIRNPLRAGDTDSTLLACRAFGASIEERKDKVIINGTRGRLTTPKAELNVENSGTTIRLFTSIAALDGKVRLTGDESIQNRPMQPLLDALSQLGVLARSLKSNGKPPIEVHGGGIPGGTTRIRGDISSQFISSLLISAPYAKKQVTIELTTPLKSGPYVDVTLDIMKDFGIKVETRSPKGFTVPNGVYRARDYQVEGDYSSASYFMALAAICNVKAGIGNLEKNTAQGDRRLLDVVKQMGAGVKEGKNTVTIQGRKLHGITVDLSDTPDLLPTVAAIASAAEGKTEINNVGHARLKETDRVSACAAEFSKFGARIIEGKDSLEIYGAKKLRGAKVNSYGDHRMVMALSILGICAEGETLINHAESVCISFPRFFDSLKDAGAKVEFNK